MNTREEAIQAFSDYQAGGRGKIPAVTDVHNAPTTVVGSGQPKDRAAPESAGISAGLGPRPARP